MSAHHPQSTVALLRMALEVLRDVKYELDQPEISELTTPRLDAKVEEAIETLEGALGE